MEADAELSKRAARATVCVRRWVLRLRLVCRRRLEGVVVQGSFLGGVVGDEGVVVDRRDLWRRFRSSLGRLRRVNRQPSTLTPRSTYPSFIYACFAHVPLYVIEFLIGPACLQWRHRRCGCPCQRHVV